MEWWFLRGTGITQAGFLSKTIPSLWCHETYKRTKSIHGGFTVHAGSRTTEGSKKHQSMARWKRLIEGRCPTLHVDNRIQSWVGTEMFGEILILRWEPLRCRVAHIICLWDYSLFGNCLCPQGRGQQCLWLWPWDTKCATKEPIMIVLVLARSTCCYVPVVSKQDHCHSCNFLLSRMFYC